MKSTQTNAQARCPACLKKADGATDAFGDAVPKPNDISLCLYCGQICIFQTDLTLRAVKPEELAAFSDKLFTRVQLARRAILASDFLKKTGNS